MGEGEGKEGTGCPQTPLFSRIVGFAGKRFLFSPPPPPSTFFCFRSNFRAITRLETLATQARRRPAPNAKIIGHACAPTSRSSLFSRLIFTVHFPRRLRTGYSQTDCLFLLFTAVNQYLKCNESS